MVICQIISSSLTHFHWQCVGYITVLYALNYLWPLRIKLETIGYHTVFFSAVWNKQTDALVIPLAANTRRTAHDSVEMSDSSATVVTGHQVLVPVISSTNLYNRPNNNTTVLTSKFADTDSEILFAGQFKR